MLRNKHFLIILLSASLFLLPAFIFASDSVSGSAWSENAGWIDFGSAQGNVQVAGASTIGLEFTGYAYSETLGWISLNCKNTNTCSTTNYSVTADDYGTISGTAYGENTGWINFNPPNVIGVSIDTNGDFSGWAYGESIGWISFNCSNTNSCATVSYKVNTSFHPQVRPAGFGGAGANFSFNPNFYQTVPTSTPAIRPAITINPAPTENPAELTRLQAIVDNLKSQIQNFSPKNSPNLITQTLRLGSRGSQVLLLQNKLNVPGANGFFGKATQKAVQDFQRANNIVAPNVYGYGIVGPATRKILNEK